MKKKTDITSVFPLSEASNRELEGAIDKVSCVVLVGGESRRMKGDDKASAVLCGKSLLTRVVEAVLDAYRDDSAPDVMISAHTGDYRLPPVQNKEVQIRDKNNTRHKPRLIADTLPGRGPALGVCSALEHARYDWVMVLSCDLPLVRGCVIKWLVSIASTHANNYDAVVPVVGGKVQTLFALYNKSCLPLLTERVKKGRRGLLHFLKEPRLRIRYVTEEELKKIDPELRSFVDVDTAEELKKVEKEFFLNTK